MTSDKKNNMTVPTHNLYDFINNTLENQFLIYAFSPWGAKELENLKCINWPAVDDNLLLGNIRPPDFINNIVPNKKYRSYHNEFYPVCVCNDQEPLNFDFYRNDSLDADKNLRNILPFSYQKQWVLLHSEINSREVDKYRNTNLFKTAYWWSHAIIARDWYRFAEHDTRLLDNCYKKVFLVYARGTTGSRYYRTQFLKSIKKSTNLASNCQIGSFVGQKPTGDFSAFYDRYDFQSTQISLVLETIFDNRIHLTEKTLRPIACGHPFILAAGPGSLELLKKYGFKTFHPYINENYDRVADSNLRMQKIINEMERICNLDYCDQQFIFSKIRDIASFNKKLFFSKNFAHAVTEELKQNVKMAYDQTDGYDYKIIQKDIKESTNIGNNEHKKYRQQCYKKFADHLEKGGTLDNYVPPEIDF